MRSLFVVVAALLLCGPCYAHEDVVAMGDATNVHEQQHAQEEVRPFHLAVPVHSIEAARAFYGGILQCAEGRSSERWVDWNLYGSQLVTHFVGSDYRGVDYFNGVDGDDVPVHHYGAVLTVPQFKELESRLRAANTKFIIEPHVRFQGLPGEQWTMFFKDPSGNNIEFKAMHRTDALFAKQ